MLEWAGGTAAAYCCKVLSDLGAEVVRAQLDGRVPHDAGGPSPTGSTLDDLRSLYLTTGKRTLLHDASTDAAERLAELARQADVIVTDEAASAEMPLPDPLPGRVICCSITPFGLVGPYSGYSGTHLTVFQSGGEGHLIPSGAGWEQFPDRPPLQLGSEIGLFDTGANAAVAILGAVYRQRATGQGELIDVSAQESQLTLNRTRLSRFNNDGVEMRRGPSGYGAGGMLECSDGRIQLVGVRPEHWQKLESMDEGAELANAARWTGGSDEIALQRAALVEWCRARPRATAVRILAEAGCPVGAYCTPSDMLTDPQLAHREFFQVVPSVNGAGIPLPGAPYQMSATPVSLEAGSRQDIVGASFETPAIQHPGEAKAESGRPLEGIRIVDFTWAAAGPYATLLLAFLGAEVIKVETSRRRHDPAREGSSPTTAASTRAPTSASSTWANGQPGST